MHAPTVRNGQHSPPSRQPERQIVNVAGDVVYIRLHASSTRNIAGTQHYALAGVWRYDRTYLQAGVEVSADGREYPFDAATTL